MIRTAAALVALALPASARADEPSTGALLGAGVAMALPTYALGVAWHEGTHAAVAHLFGAEVQELRLYPSHYKGNFYFGLTRWRGDMTDGERAFTLLAPKLTDALLFGAYAALLYTDSLPDNEYGQLAFAVLATGAWVDFGKDVFSFHPTNDVIKAHALLGRPTERERWPYRLLHLGATLGAAVVLYHGYAEIFDSPHSPSVVLPLASTRF